MPVHTGYDSNNKPSCFAQWGNSGKKYYYTCGDKEAMNEAKAKANTQGQAIRASGWQGKSKKKGDENNLVRKDKQDSESYEAKIKKVRNAFEGNPQEIGQTGESNSMMVIYTFDSSVILKDYNTDKYYEADYSILEDGSIVKGNPKEVELVYVQKRLVVDSLDFSSIKNIDDIKNALDEVKKYDWSWAGSFDKCVEILTDKPGIDNPEGLCSWLHHEAEGTWPGEKEREERIAKNKGCELTGPIVKKNNLQRIVYAPVLIPGEPDYDYEKGEEILTKETIERVAHKWMLDYMNIDVMHSLNNVAKPVETFILPMEWNVEAYGKKMKLPVGSWIMASKIVDDDTWKKIESGELTGYSVMGIKNTALKSLLDNASKNKDILADIKASMKRTLLKDLGEDWIVPFVSIVDEACVPKSKFFAIKSKEIDEEKRKSILEKIKDIFNVEKKGRTISDATFGDLKKAWESLGKLITKAEEERDKTEKSKEGEIEMKDEEIKALVEKAIDEKLKPLSDSLELINKTLAEKKVEVKVEDANAGKPKVEESAEELAKKTKDAEVIQKLQDKVKELDELVKKGKSNAIRGDDNLENKDKEIDDNRDSLGRAKKKKY